MKITACAVLVSCLFVLTAPDLQAQLRGRVLDDAGRPVRSAAIELWSDTARVSVLLSGDDGVFIVPPDLLDSSRRLTISLIGYHPLSVSTNGLGESGTFTLLRSPSPIEPLQVTGTRLTCTGTDEPAARTLWQTAASRYSQPAGLFGLHTMGSVRRGYVSPAEVGAAYSQRESFDGTVMWSVPIDETAERIRRTGYAWVKPVREGLSGGPFADDFEHWEYVALDSRDSYHFASDLFGELHRFHILDSGERMVTIGFCPQRTNRASISGVFEIAIADTSLTFASWRFATRGPDERAGGEAMFAPPSPPDSPPRPVAVVRGAYWRYRESVGMSYQRAVAFRFWEMTEIMPPRRR